MNPKIILLDAILNQQRESIAQKVVEKQYEREAAFWLKFGEEGRRISLRDAAYHLPFITESTWFLPNTLIGCDNCFTILVFLTKPSKLPLSVCVKPLWKR